MAPKWISVCVVALLCCLCGAQYPSRPQIPVKPVMPDPVQTCDVAENYKIQCGPADINAETCEAINCCFDGRMCYYGRAVTLQCTKDGQFIVVVARDVTLPPLDLETIGLLGADEGCGPAGATPAFAIYQFPVTSCGTVVMEDRGVLIYENRMSASYEVAVGNLGAITRDSQYELLVQCRYSGASIQALVVEVNMAAMPVPVAAPGPLRVELRLGNGICLSKGCVERDVAYNSFYVEEDYPVMKVLRDPVYAEVRMLGRNDPNLILTLGRCWATSDSNPLSLPQWDLLIDGCPYQEDRYQTVLVPVDSSSGLPYPTHHRRFIFKMFTFVGTEAAEPNVKNPDGNPSIVPLREKVHIHCSTSVCEAMSGGTCEPRCFRKRREVGAAVRKTTKPVLSVVTSGEIIISRA